MLVSDSSWLNRTTTDFILEFLGAPLKAEESSYKPGAVNIYRVIRFGRKYLLTKFIYLTAPWTGLYTHGGY